MLEFSSKKKLLFTLRRLFPGVKSSIDSLPDSPDVDSLDVESATCGGGGNKSLGILDLVAVFNFSKPMWTRIINADLAWAPLMRFTDDTLGI